LYFALFFLPVKSCLLHFDAGITLTPLNFLPLVDIVVATSLGINHGCQITAGAFRLSQNVQHFINLLSCIRRMAAFLFYLSRALGLGFWLWLRYGLEKKSLLTFYSPEQLNEKKYEFDIMTIRQIIS
jgi:hypothetical protein